MDILNPPETDTLADALRTAACLTGPQRATFADLTGDLADAHMLRRGLTGVYLRRREEHEDDPTPVSEALMVEARGLLCRALVAADEADEGTVSTVVDALTFPQGAERFVELWAAREGLLWDLDSGAICAVADSVRDWVGDGGELGQAPMRAWAAPYLAVAP